MRHRWLAYFAVVSTLLTSAAGAIAQEATPNAGTATPGSSTAAANCAVGRQADGSVVLPTDQILRPAGAQVEFLGRPNDVVIRPDGKTVAFLTVPNYDSKSPKGPIVVVDLASMRVIQNYAPAVGDKTMQPSYAGIAYSPDGSTLFAADFTGLISVSKVAADGTLTLDRTIAVAQGEQSPRIGGFALSADGKTLYIALNAKNALAVVDIASGAVSAEIPVGNAPFGVVIAGDKAYVSNQGGRPASVGDTTNNSGGTRIVSDAKTGGVATGTVSVVDLVTNEQITTIDVGLQPTAQLVHDGYIFVANTNSDTISVIDPKSDEVVKTIAIQVFPGAPFGSSPNALAFAGNDQLLVSLGRNNAIAAFTWIGPDEAVKFEGLVPTGWYPASLAIDSTNDRLVVANAKGVGSLGPETDEAGPETKNPSGMWVHSNMGSASVIPLVEFATGRIAVHTAEVFANNQWSTARCSEATRQAANTGAAGPAAIPLRIGDPSRIKHVFYIIKENRTYDQVLGDLQQGNGDPSLVQFGQAVTPNQHALAQQFALLDNLYDSGSLSADGHQWSTQAYVDDYLEKAFGDFSRSYPFNGTDALAYSPTGFIWDNALANGLTVRNYGEYCNQFTDQNDPFGSKFGAWETWYHDYQVLHGDVSGSLNYPLGVYQTRTDVPSLDAVTNREFPPYSTNIPDQYRAEIFLQEFAKYEQSGTLPNLILMSLPADHTSGTAPGAPTPKAQVADNDLALGRMIDAITHSKFWPESAIFVIEDDAQNGVDHVDGHRTTGYVISPYVKHGAVVSTYYTQIDMVRTIEQILGLPPMNQMDLAASPMWDLFTDTPDLTPYTAVANSQPLDEMNPPASAVTGLQAAWASASAAMGFGDLADITRGPDAKDENLLNHAIWYGTMGYDTPYPGEDRVLYPWEVTPAQDEFGHPTAGNGGE